MSKQTQEKDRAKAKYLSAHHVERTSGACPWGCGAQIKNGGQALSGHLGKCRGPFRGTKKGK